MRIVKTTLLLSDNGKEFDTGRTTRKTVYLATLSKDEALKRLRDHKLVYFIYENERIFHETCRKVAANDSYVKRHYDVYFECCGRIAPDNMLGDQEIEVLNLLAKKSGMDCWFSIRSHEENGRRIHCVRDMESDNVLTLSEGLQLFAEGLLKLNFYGLNNFELEVATMLFDRFGLLDKIG